MPLSSTPGIVLSGHSRLSTVWRVVLRRSFAVELSVEQFFDFHNNNRADIGEGWEETAPGERFEWGGEFLFVRKVEVHKDLETIVESSRAGKRAVSVVSGSIQWGQKSIQQLGSEYKCDFGRSVGKPSCVINSVQEEEVLRGGAFPVSHAHAGWL